MKTKVLKSKAQRAVRVRRARLKMAIVGRWTRWDKGILVKARKLEDGNFFIERARRIKPDVFCANQMVGVPRDMLSFEAGS